MTKTVTMVIAAAMIAAFGSVQMAQAKTVGVTYTDGLVIPYNGTATASISNLGVLTVASIVNSGAFSATTLAGTTLSLSGAETVLGASYLGDATTRSTHTAAGALDLHAGLSAATVASDATVVAATNVTATAGSVSAGTTVTAGTNIIATAGFIQTYSRSLAQIMAITPTAVGQVYFCNNCSPVEMAMSTGTSVGMFANFSGAQLD